AEPSAARMRLARPRCLSVERQSEDGHLAHCREPPAVASGATGGLAPERRLRWLVRPYRKVPECPPFRRKCHHGEFAHARRQLGRNRRDPLAEQPLAAVAWAAR